MNFSFARTGRGGHTAVEFNDDSITLEWEKTSSIERKMLSELISNARENGMKTFAVGDDGEEQVTDKLPGLFFNRKGKMVIRGHKDGCKIVAKNLFESEIKDKRIIFEAQKDHSWSMVRIEDVKNKIDEKVEDGEKKEKKKYTSTAMVGGG